MPQNESALLIQLPESTFLTSANASTADVVAPNKMGNIGKHATPVKSVGKTSSQFIEIDKFAMPIAESAMSSITLDIAHTVR